MGYRSNLRNATARNIPDRKPRVLGGIWLPGSARGRWKQKSEVTFFLELLVEVPKVDGLVRGDVAGQHLLLRGRRRSRGMVERRDGRGCFRSSRKILLFRFFFSLSALQASNSAALFR
jgi:hypothetical protein